MKEQNSQIERIPDEEWSAQYKDVSHTLRDLWDVELDLLSKFDEICKKYKLTWFVDGGTLLGAVRHQGFIPWDDDIDIIMPWKDYQKLSILSNEFRYPYFLQTWETEDGFDPFMMKLRRSDTTGYNWREKRCKMDWNKGISIDIFALIDIPDSFLVRTIQLLLLKAIRALFRGYEAIRDNRQTANSLIVNRMIIWLYTIISPVADYKALSKVYLNIGGWQKTKSYRCGPLLFVPGEKEFCWLSQWYNKVEYLPFMGRMVPCPAGWHSRLTAQYHEYLVPIKDKSKHGELIYDPYTPYNESNC